MRLVKLTIERKKEQGDPRVFVYNLRPQLIQKQTLPGILMYIPRLSLYIRIKCGVVAYLLCKGKGIYNRITFEKKKKQVNCEDFPSLNISDKQTCL